MLREDVLVGYDAQHLYFARSNGNSVRVESNLAASRSFAASFRLGHFEHFSDLPFISRELLTALSHASLLTESAVHTVASNTVIRGDSEVHITGLREVVLNPPTRETLEQPLVVTTNREILLLPAACSLRVRRAALRLFVSGLNTNGPLETYAFVASTGEPSVVLDNPSPDAVYKALEIIKEADLPQVYDLNTGQISRWATLPGRLHIVQTMQKTVVDLGPLILHQFAVTFACPNLRVPEPEAERRAWGMSTRHRDAKRKAVSEAIERFASGNVRSRDIIVSAPERLPGPYLDPRRIICFSEDQYERHPELRPFNEKDENCWVRASGPGGTEVFVLADLVYYPFARPGRGYPQVFAPATSSGVACRRDATTAKIEAVWELVERDAVMVTWFGRHSRERVSRSSLPRTAQAILDTVERHGWATNLHNISQGELPSLLAVAMRRNELVLGAAAGPPERAAIKAAFEMSACLGQKSDSNIRPEQVNSPLDHQLLYKQRRYVKGAEFLTSSRAEVPLTALPHADLHTILDDSYFVRLPTARVARRQVWRCLSPRLIPITFGWDLEPLGLPRVIPLIQEAGTSLAQPLVPHPFA